MDAETFQSASLENKEKIWQNWSTTYEICWYIFKVNISASKTPVLIKHAAPTKGKTNLGKPVQSTTGILSIILSLGHRSI